MDKETDQKIIVSNFQTIDGKIYTPYADAGYVYIPMMMGTSSAFYYKLDKRLFLLGEEYEN